MYESNFINCESCGYEIIVEDNQECYICPECGFKDNI